MTNPVIFLVEDEADHQELIKIVLEQNRLSVFSTDSGERALPLIKQMKPDVVVLDVVLPGLDGFEICKKLRADPDTAHLPIILLTSRSADEDRKKGTDVGANLYLIKPFGIVKLVDEIRTLLPPKRN